MAFLPALAAIAAIAGTGASIGLGIAQAGDARDARNRQQAAVDQQNAKLAETQKQNDATAAARTARLRQRALLSGAQGVDSTIATSPLGLSSSGAPAVTPLKKTLGGA